MRKLIQDDSLIKARAVRKSKLGFKMLQCFGFRKNPRTYDTHELMGNVAIVSEVCTEYIRVVTHDLNRVEVLELMPEDFFNLFTLDPYLTPLAAARELRQARNIMVTVPPANDIIENFIQRPPTLEEVTVGKIARSKAAVAVQTNAQVCADFNRRTCIAISRTSDAVMFIPLASHGLELETLTPKEFDEIYKALPDYPADKAAKLYAEYTRHIGATKDAMRELAKLTHILDKEIEMATAKKAANAAKNAEKKPIAKGVKKAPAAKTAKAPKAATEKKPTASARFKELIMEGKLTDKAIFAKVASEFGLDDSKASYVKWYRNDLTKKGMNPPAAKAEK